MKLSDLLVPSTKFSKFRCDTYKKFSANPGILYPVWMNILNPGESVSMDLRSVIRTWPVKSPLMGSIKVRFATVAFNLKNYAMALEGYKRNFDWRSVQLPVMNFNIQENLSIDDYQVVSTVNDKKTMFNYSYLCGVADTSLADYLGYETGWFANPAVYPSPTSAPYHLVQKSFLPFLCYYDFYRNYLINPQEKKFPMFHTRLGLKDFKSDDPKPYWATDAEQYVYNQSAVSWVDVSVLDNLIDECHKMCDIGNDNTGRSEVNYPLTKPAFFDTYMYITQLPNLTFHFNQFGVFWSSTHGGLVSTTFDPDINTLWLSVDNYQKLNDVKINTQTVSSNTFTSFGDIVKASSLWDFITRSVNSDGTYSDFIGNQFGVSVKGDMNIPQIVHVYDTILTFDDITSQSDTSLSDDSEVGAVIGQQAGVGRSYGQSNRFKVVNKDGNYVILMTFMWATPQVCYRSGINFINNIASFSDLYQPAFDNYAMQPRLQEFVKSSLTAIDVNSNVYDSAYTPFYYPNTFNNGPSAYVELGYQPAYSEYKSDVDVVHGMFRHALDYYTIIRDIVPVTESNDVLSSYVYAPTQNAVWAYPEACQRYSLPFAISAEDCMQVQLRVGATFTRAMSKNVNPNVK